MSEEYRHHFFVKRTAPFNAETECGPLRELSAAEKAKVAENRAAVHTHIPEAVSFIAELHEAGMIDGWRGVGEVELIANKGVLPYAPTGRKRHGTA